MVYHQKSSTDRHTDRCPTLVPLLASDLSTRLCLKLTGEVGGQCPSVYSHHMEMRRILMTVRPQGTGPSDRALGSSAWPQWHLIFLVPAQPTMKPLLSHCSLGEEGSGLVGFIHTEASQWSYLGTCCWSHPINVESACSGVRRSHLPELRG